MPKKGKAKFGAGRRQQGISEKERQARLELFRKMRPEMVEEEKEKRPGSMAEAIGRKFAKKISRKKKKKK